MQNILQAKETISFLLKKTQGFTIGWTPQDSHLLQQDLSLLTKIQAEINNNPDVLLTASKDDIVDISQRIIKTLKPLADAAKYINKFIIPALFNKNIAPYSRSNKNTLCYAIKLQRRAGSRKFFVNSLKNGQITPYQIEIRLDIQPKTANTNNNLNFIIRVYPTEQSDIRCTTFFAGQSRQREPCLVTINDKHDNIQRLIESGLDYFIKRNHPAHLKFSI